MFLYIFHENHLGKSFVDLQISKLRDILRTDIHIWKGQLMAIQKKQHYVPQFYMKNFANEKGRIFLLQTADYSVRRDIPYKSQCTIDYFYGKDGVVENILSKKEAEWSAVIRKLLNEEAIAEKEICVIREFVIYQRQRTEAEDQNQQDEKSAVIKEVAKMVCSHEGLEYDEEIVGDYSKKNAKEITPPAESLQMVQRIEPLIQDLSMKVICYNTQHELVYSDAPVVFINPFFPSAIGYGSMGLIILVPISKNKLLVLFDQGVYSCDTSRFYVPSNDEDEVVHLNVLQLISANERVMAHSDTEFSFFDESAKSARVKNREAQPTRTLGDLDNKLIVTSMRKCIYPHEWNFVKMIRKAKKIPFPCREAVYREWSPEWENKLEAKVHFMPSVMTSIPKGMTDKELVGGFQKMASFAKEYWRNRSLRIKNH